MRKSRLKYEVIEINNVSVSVDVSLLRKTEELFFNATELAKAFGKRLDDFWKQEQNREYLNALITLSEGNTNDFIHTRCGSKYGGTWFHKSNE